MEDRRPIRVLVVEDQPKILKNQLKLLDAAADLIVIGTATSGEEALKEIPNCKPEVLLLDLGLPQMSGIDVTREVKARWPGIEILIFTIFDEEQKVLEAIRAGASGYLLKGATADKIVEAICDVRAGGTVIQPNLARNLLKHFRADAPAAPEALVPGQRPLSEREKEILQIIAKGISNNEAAAMLGVSKATIRTHLEHIYAKLEVTNRVEAVTEGIRKGLIDM
ncbi:MAG: response regulator transcription factor [Myxococcales bacterium]|jgi:DNA-binding NarL/FixJ family response regulator|nr:response regulator transcription factor [Myxococcales bacterium]